MALTPEQMKARNELEQKKRQLVTRIHNTGTIELDIGAPRARKRNRVQVSTDLTNWTVDSFRSLSLDFLDQVVKHQAKLDNYLERYWVDGKIFGNLEKFNRNIHLQWPGGNDIRPVMNDLAAMVKAEGITGVRWAWKVAATSSRKRDIQKMIASGGPVYLESGEQVLYVPIAFTGSFSYRPTRPDPTYENVLFSQAAKQGRGRYSRVSAKMKNRAKIKGATVKAIHTLKYTPPGRELPPGVPSVGFRNPSTGAYYQGAWGFIIRLSLLGRRPRGYKRKNYG